MYYVLIEALSILSKYLTFVNKFQISHALANDVQLRGCTCGTATVLNMTSLIKACNLDNINERQVAKFMVDDKVGCVGKQYKLGTNRTNKSVLHIPNRWLQEQGLKCSG